MHWYLLLPLAAAIIYPLGSIFLKTGMDRGGGVFRSFFVSNIALALCFAPLLFFVRAMPDWNHVGWPLLTGATFFLGQLFTILAIRVGDVSIQAPLMGTKVILVAVISFFLKPEEVSPVLWLGAALSTVAVFMLGGGSLKGLRENGDTILMAIVSCVFFALTDALMGYRSRGFGPTAFVIVMAWSLALYSCVMIPFFKEPLRAIPKEAWPGVFWGSVALGVQAVFIGVALGQFGQATAINIVYAARGLFGVVFVWSIGHWFGNQERHTAGPELMKKRLVGSMLLTVAIAMALI